MFAHDRPLQPRSNCNRGKPKYIFLHWSKQLLCVALGTPITHTNCAAQVKIIIIVCTIDQSYCSHYLCSTGQSYCSNYSRSTGLSDCSHNLCSRPICVCVGIYIYSNCVTSQYSIAHTLYDSTYFMSRMSVLRLRMRD